MPYARRPEPPEPVLAPSSCYREEAMHCFTLCLIAGGMRAVQEVLFGLKSPSWIVGHTRKGIHHESKVHQRGHERKQAKVVATVTVEIARKGLVAAVLHFIVACSVVASVFLLTPHACHEH